MAGENLTLSYFSEGVVATRCRCNKFAYGYEIIATESHAREHRAMYPHQRAIGKFQIGVQFKNYGEYKTFMDYLRGYAESWLHPPSGEASYTPGILVALVAPDYKLLRTGVPISGITEGDHVGNTTYNSAITFQTVVDPLDPQTVTGASGQEPIWSTVQFSENSLGGEADDDTMKFFYPWSPGSRDITTEPTDVYGVGRLSGGGGGGSSAPAAPSLADQFWDRYGAANPGSGGVAGLPGR